MKGKKPWSVEVFGSLAELMSREDETSKHLDATFRRIVKTFRVEGQTVEVHILVTRKRIG